MYEAREKKHRLKPKPQKAKRIKPEVFKDKDYLSWLHNDKQPHCALCGKPYHSGTELHHIRDRSILGRDDRYVIALCGVECHRLGKMSAHGGTKQFNEVCKIETQFKLANLIYLEYLNK